MSNDLIVSKDNKLIQASYSLSVSETRVILLCLAKWDSRKSLPDDNVFTLSVDDFSEFDVSRQNAYRDLQNAVDRLYSRTIKLDINEPGAEMRWVYKKIPSKIKGTVTLSFAPEIIPYISELKKRFTTYKLKDVAHFKNQYSVRIYELLMQWKDRNELKVEVNWLRDILQLWSGKGKIYKYPAFKDLRERVIEPALEDINEHSNLNVVPKYFKTGKQITHIQFIYTPKEVKNPKATKAVKQSTYKPPPDLTPEQKADIAASHEALKAKHEPAPKKPIADEKKQKIAGLRKATTG